MKTNFWHSEQALFNKDNITFRSSVIDRFERTTFFGKDYPHQHDVERVNEVSDLGVLTDIKRTFAHHIEQIAAHARQINGYIKRSSNGKFTMETRKLLYLTYVRSKLEFASVVWSPHQKVYIDDIESVQKQVVIDLLESRSNATSYRLAPYVDRCELLKIQPLSLRRQINDVVLAYDIYKRYVKDDFLSSKFVNSSLSKELRVNRLLDETVYNAEYLSQQPISRMIGLINKFSDLVVESCNRGEFKSCIVKALKVQTNCNCY